MKITPLDIQQMGFKIRWKGYDCKEVDGFLETITEDYEALIKENLTLKEQMAHAEEEIKEYKKKDAMLSQTLISAQGLIEMQKANTTKEAAMIIKEAESQAEQVVKAVREEASRMKSDIMNLRRQKMILIEKLRAMVRSFEASLTIEEQEMKEAEKIS